MLMKNNINISKEDSYAIIDKVNKKLILTDSDDILSSIDNELKHMFIAREVSLYIKKNNMLEENEFYLVKFPYEDTVIDISVGYVKTIKEEESKLIYGLLYR